jgi:hypothetical protein
MSKQSSIKWLVTELNQMIDYIPLNKWDKIADIIQQAKQMHKEEIADAYWEGGQDIPKHISRCEEYYQKTYGGNNESNT